MANTPTVSSPADFSSPTLPFDISGTTSANALVEVRGENGLLLPATANPVAASGAGAFTIAQVSSLIGNHGGAYVSARGTVSAGATGVSVSDNFTGTGGAALNSANWVKHNYYDLPLLYNNRVSCASAGVREAIWNGTPVAPDQVVIAQLSDYYPDTVTRGVYLRARCAKDNEYYVEVGLLAAGGGWGRRFNASVSGPGGTYNLPGVPYLTDTDDWAKLEVIGCVVKVYTGTNGTSWTLRLTGDYTSTPSYLPATGQPAIYLAGAGDSGVNYWIDNFSASSSAYYDNFTGTDGSALSSNWGGPTGEIQDPVYIYSNHAVPAVESFNRTCIARWIGGDVGANQIITWRGGPGIASSGPELIFRHTPVDMDPRVAVESKYEADGVTPSRVYKAPSWTAYGVSTSDTWHRCYINGHVFHFYSSADGSTWTWRHCISSVTAASATGGPAAFFNVGRGATGTADTVFADDFSLEALPATAQPNLLTHAQATTVGDTANGWSVIGSTIVVTTGQTDPLGGTAATRLTITGWPQIAGPTISGLVPGTLYTCSLWVKRGSTSDGTLYHNHNFPTNTDIYRTIGAYNGYALDTWQRTAMSWVQGSDTSVQLKLHCEGSGVWDVWGMKLEASPFPSGAASDI